jgi:hypothetical protein
LVGLPVLGLLVLWVVIGALPGSDCNGSSGGSSVAEIAVAVVASVASVGAIAAGGYRLGATLFREPGFSAVQAVFAAFAIVGGAFLSSALFHERLTSLGRIQVTGVLVTGILLLELVVTLFARLDADQAGLLLALYLLGAGLFVYPLLAQFAVAASNGAFC